MREIKFRVWDKRTNQMSLVAKISFGDDGTAQTIMAELAPKGEYYNAIIHGESGVLIQFTGLKDSTGRDIYEGDIIQLRSVRADRIADEGTGRVYWREDELQWWITDGTPDPVCGGLDYDLTYLRCFQEVSVIGNIYENHDLLAQNSNATCKN